MTVSTAYPLEQIIKVKERRVAEQEKVVRAKEQALQLEKDKLVEREKDRDAAKQHEADKLAQLRAELDQNIGTTTSKVQQMKAYLKVAKEKVQVEEKKVKEQQVQVDSAKKALDLAIEDLRMKRQQVDKLVDHKKVWTKEMRKELEIIEAREQDELGSTTFINYQRMSRKYNK